MAYPSQNIQEILGTFVDGQVVSAEGATYGLNPKMERIRSVVNDHASKLDALNAQVSGLGGLVYNVVAYGADPTGVADSTTAIKNTVADAIANKGIVVFSNGTYKITDAITLSGTCYITSDGSGQGVIVRQATASKSIFIVTSNYVRITDLKLEYGNATTPTQPLIYVNSGYEYAYITGLIIQRCSFSSGYLGPSITAISGNNITGSAITDCTMPGSPPQYGAFANFSRINLSIISRNTCYYVSGFCTTSASSAGLIIEQNYVSNYTNSPVNLYNPSGTYIDKNLFNGSTDTSGSIAAIKTMYADYVYITDNSVDHSSSASTTGSHGGVANIYPLGNVIISGNYFLLGKWVISTVSSSGSCIISKNLFIKPELAAIYSDSCGTSFVITDNVFDNVWSNGSSSPSCIMFDTTVGYPYSNKYSAVVSNNVMNDIASVTATYKNVYGVYQPNGSYGSRTICLSGNNFNKATTAAISASSFSIFYNDPTGASVYNATTAAPTTGTWKTGDKVVLSSPSAGGYIGYVCTSGGTPGTWKGYGAIQA